MGNEPKTPKAINIVRPSSYNSNSSISHTSFNSSTTPSSQTPLRKPRILTSAQILNPNKDSPSFRIHGGNGHSPNNYLQPNSHQYPNSPSSVSRRSSPPRKPTLFSPSSFGSSNGGLFTSHGISPATSQKLHSNSNIANSRDHATNSYAFSHSSSSNISVSRTHSTTHTDSHSDDETSSNVSLSDIYQEDLTKDGGLQPEDGEGQNKVVAKVKGGTIVNGRGEVLNKTAYEAGKEARINRKILDLEISNKSLLAVNEQLETTVRRQAEELAKLKKRSSGGSEYSTSPVSDIYPHTELGIDEDVREIIEEDPIFNKICGVIEQLIKNAEEALTTESKMSGRVLFDAGITTEFPKAIEQKSIAELVDEEEEAEFQAEAEAQGKGVLQLGIP